MIPAKEEAKELVDKFEPYVIRYTQDDVVGYLDQQTPILEYQKQCALIAVDLHLEELSKMKLIFSDREIHYKHWQEVKQEIELL